MRTKYYILFLLISLVFFSFSYNTKCQNTQKNIAINESNLTSSQLLERAKDYFPDSLDLTIKYGRMCLEASRAEHAEKPETEILDLLSKAFYFKGNKQESYTYLQLVKVKYEHQKDINNLCITLNRIGSIYNEWGLYDEAMQYFVKALKIVEKPKDNGSYGDRIAQSCNNLGLLYKDLEEYDKAYEYCNRALNYYKKSNNQKSIGFSLNNLGIIYKRLGEYEKALSYYNESLIIKRKLNEKGGTANTLGNIGDIYRLIGKYDLALKNYNEALITMTELSDNYGIANTLNNIAIINNINNNPDKAINLLNDAMPLAKKSGLRDLQKDILKTYSESFEKKNDLSASLKYYKQYTELKDSIFNEGNAKRILELDAAYSSEKRERENENLRLKSQKKDEEIAAQISMKYILLLIIIFIFFILLLFFVRSKILHKSQKVLEEKNVHIAHINEELLSVNEELDQRVQERTSDLLKEISEKEIVLHEVKLAYKKAEEANLLKDAFLANINHEIRTPLSAIIGLAEVTRNKIPKTHETSITKYIEGIQQSGHRLLNLLNNILDISRIEANDFKINIGISDVNKIVRNAADLFRFVINEKGLKLTLNLAETHSIIADFDILTKVTADIIDNAVKYTSGGVIEISTGYNIGSGEVFIKITDSGIGIDENYLPHIFETFRQESMGYARLYQGAGLGLPLAKRLMKLMNGRIEVSSKKDFGTTVYIYLPSAKDHNSSISSVSMQSVTIPDNDVLIKGFEILLVEDDKFNALFLQTILESVGNVSLATGGEEALLLISEKIANNKTFDIVILDINLPENWEGVQLKKEIVKKYNQYAHIPFIAQSAYSLKSDKDRILNEGFIDFLTKPVDSEKLLNAVKKQFVKKIDN